MPTRPGARGDAFRLRLALAFLGVALAAVALLAVAGPGLGPAHRRGRPGPQPGRSAVASSPGFTAQPGPPSGAALVVCGQRIGEAVTRFTGAGLSATDRRLQATLLRAIAGAAGLAALPRGPTWSRPAGSPGRSPS